MMETPAPYVSSSYDDVMALVPDEAKPLTVERCVHGNLCISLADRDGGIILLPEQSEFTQKELDAAVAHYELNVPAWDMPVEEVSADLSYIIRMAWLEPGSDQSYMVLVNPNGTILMAVRLAGSAAMAMTHPGFVEDGVILTRIYHGDVPSLESLLLRKG